MHVAATETISAQSAEYGKCTPKIFFVKSVAHLVNNLTNYANKTQRYSKRMWL